MKPLGITCLLQALFVSVVSAQGIVYDASSLWTENHDIIIDGDLAYCAYDQGLAIFDISDLTQPELIGNLPLFSECTGIEYRDLYVFIAASETGLVIASVENPRFPEVYRTCPTHGDCRDLKLFNDYVIAATDSALQVVDISVMANPFIAASYFQTASSYYPNKIIIDGNRAYWLHGSAMIFDISDPTNLNLIGEIDANNFYNIYVKDTVAYVASRADFGAGNLVIFDVSNPSNPQYLGGCIALGDLYSLQVNGQYAYLVGAGVNFQIADISDLSNPEIVYSHEDFSTFYSYGIQVSGSYAYLANSYFSTFEVYDISTPISAHRIGYYDSHAEFTFDVALKGNYAYIAGYDGGLLSLDISNFSNIEITASYSDSIFPYPINSVEAQGQYLYITRQSSPPRMVIFNISEPGFLDSVGGCFLQSVFLVSDISIYNQYAFLSCEYNGFQIYDISNPASPELLYQTNPGNVTHIKAVGNYALVSGYFVGLLIYDISNPSSPENIGGIASLSVYDLDCDSEYVYAATDSGLCAVQIEDPANPTIIWTYAGSFNSVRVQGNLGYLTTWSGDLIILDLSDRLNPIELVNQPTAGRSRKADVQGNLIAVADESAVLFFTYPGYGCDYMPGDFNGDGSPNGLDISYGINYFKGGYPLPNTCSCPPLPFPFYGAGDCNGSCTFNGLDITYFIRYLKWQDVTLGFCPTCPPLRRQ
jgi:hypothetical protein